MNWTIVGRILENLVTGLGRRWREKGHFNYGSAFP